MFFMHFSPIFYDHVHWNLERKDYFVFPLFTEPTTETLLEMVIEHFNGLWIYLRS